LNKYSTAFLSFFISLSFVAPLSSMLEFPNKCMSSTYSGTELKLGALPSPKGRSDTLDVKASAFVLC
jgi:hypothetical protein